MNKQIIALVGVVGVIILLVLALAFFSEDNSSLESSAQPITSNTDNHHEGVTSDEAFRSLIGKEAPDFTLESYTGEQISLRQLRGKRVVLFFTEGLMCYPSCWNQMVAFGKDSAFNNPNTVTLSITVDNKTDWGQAVAKMPELASATVLFDTSRQVSVEYGVLTLSSSMHKGQFPGHTYLIVDRQGVIQFAQDDPQMGVRNNELKIELDKLK